MAGGGVKLLGNWASPFALRVPVLVHDGKVIVESLVILEYIEETWKNTPLLPEDPYERAMARFWVKFADDKCFPAMKGLFFSAKEKSNRLFVKEVCHDLKFLDSALNHNCCFVVEKIGFVDNVLEAAPVLKECTPPREKLVEHFKGFRKMLAAASN
nr:glutathione transferase GST 23-like [Ipomoea batatas]